MKNNFVKGLIINIILVGSLGFYLGSLSKDTYVSIGIGVLTLIIGIVTFVKSLKQVDEDEQYVRLWFGKGVEILTAGLNYIPLGFIFMKRWVILFPKQQIGIAIADVEAHHYESRAVKIKKGRIIDNTNIDNEAKDMKVIHFKNIQLELSVEDPILFLQKAGRTVKLSKEGIVTIEPTAAWYKRIQEHFRSMINSFGTYVGYTDWIDNSILSGEEIVHYTEKLEINDVFTKAVKSYGLELIMAQIGDIDLDDSTEESEKLAGEMEQEEQVLQDRIDFYRKSGYTKKEAVQAAREDLGMKTKRQTKQTIEFTGNEVDSGAAIAGGLFQKK